MNLPKLWEKVKVVLGILFVIVCILVAWSIAYWINSYLIEKMEWDITEYWAYMIDGVVALILLSTAIAIAFPFAKNKQLAFSQKITDALRRISKGDFDINIKSEKDFEHEFGTIIESIHEMAGELGQMEKMRQEFISNVSHEIQSPLTSIRGFARALQEDELTEEKRKHYLQIIETETMRLSKLSDNLLKLTSLESDHHKLEPTTYRLDGQLRNLLLASEPQWSTKQLDVELKLEKVMITADEELLSQVWVNLIHNAIKFTPERGAITIVLQNNQNMIEVSIEDTGTGIAEEHHSHLFERFFKGDASRNRAEGGSGLGLSIVHKIIELHQGSIQVKSERGSGTTFVIKLPDHQ